MAIKLDKNLYTKSELADMYGESRGTIMNEVYLCKPLLTKLEELGFEARTPKKLLTRRMVEIIFEYLGEPEQDE